MSVLVNLDCAKSSDDAREQIHIVAMAKLLMKCILETVSLYIPSLKLSLNKGALNMETHKGRHPGCP